MSTLIFYGFFHFGCPVPSLFVFTHKFKCTVRECYDGKSVAFNFFLSCTVLLYKLHPRLSSSSRKEFGTGVMTRVTMTL